MDVLAKRWIFVALVALVGCQEKKESAERPTGPDPEIAGLMDGKTQTPRTTVATEGPSQLDIIPPPPDAARAGAEDPAASASSADVRLVDFAGLEKELATLKGKTIVIDCWATWCGICKEKFPAFVALREQYGDTPNVVFASLANDPEDKEDIVREFVGSSAPGMICWQLDEDPADFSVKFQVDGVPAYLIFDEDGTLAYKTGTIDELAEKLAELFPQ